MLNYFFVLCDRAETPHHPCSSWLPSAGLECILCLYTELWNLGNSPKGEKRDRLELLANSSLSPPPPHHPCHHHHHHHYHYYNCQCTCVIVILLNSNWDSFVYRCFSLGFTALRPVGPSCAADRLKGSLSAAMVSGSHYLCCCHDFVSITTILGVKNIYPHSPISF